MSTAQDTRFTGRFSDMTATAFTAGGVSLANYTPTTSPINTGMMGDIGRATIYGPESWDNPYSVFMRNPLTWGDSAMTARFSQVKSVAYDPKVGDSALFDGQYPEMISNISHKNLSRQVRVEVNDRLMKQFVQVPEMIGDAASAIMSVSNVCYLDDMYTASNEYYSGSVRNAKAGQMITLDHAVSESGFAEEMNEVLYDITQVKMPFKSTLYNASGYDTKSTSAHIIMDKSVVFPTFKRQYAELFNPDYLKIQNSTGYVDSFATTAGKPSDAGNLLAIVTDPRSFNIIPMEEALSVEAFRNPARKATEYITTYEYSFSHEPFFDVFYIFGKAE